MQPTDPNSIDNQRTQPELPQPDTVPGQPDFTSPQDAWAMPKASQVDERISETHAPEPILPAVDPTPQPVQLALKRRRSKKPFLIAGAVLLAILLVGGTVFALIYNRPTAAVDDALVKLLTARSVSSEGTLAITYGEDVSIGAAYVQIADDERRQSTIVDSTIKVSGDAHSLKTSLVIDTTPNYYVRIEGAGKLLENLSRNSGDYTAVATLLTDFAKAIDNTWIVIKQSDLAGGGEESETGIACTEKAISQLRGDRGQIEELTSRYKKHRFITVEKTVGIEMLNGAPHHRYEIGVNKERLEQYAESLKSTELFRLIDVCWGGALAQQYTPSEIAEAFIASEGEDLTYELWVNMLTHEPSRFTVYSSASEPAVSLKLETNLRLNQPLAVTVPEPDKTIPELQAQLQSIIDTDISDLPAQIDQTGMRARDIERQTDIAAIAMQLEMYYNAYGSYPAPSELTQTAVIATLEGVDLEALKAPGQGNYSLIPATGIGYQTPAKNQYIYQALDTDGTLCTRAKSCKHFVLWYFLESDQSVLEQQSFN